MTIGTQVQEILNDLESVRGSIGRIAGDAVAQARKQWEADAATVQAEEIQALRDEVAALKAALPQDSPPADSSTPTPEPDSGAAVDPPTA